MGNLIKYDATTWYIPFNTLTGRPMSMESDNGKSMIHLTVRNKNGSATMDIVFTESKFTDDTEYTFNLMSGDWVKRAGQRKQHINDAFNTVYRAAYQAKRQIDKIQKIKDSDEQKKKDLEAKITAKKKEVQTLTNEVTEANTKFVKASGELATVETRLSNERSKRSKLIIEKQNLEANIKILKGDVKPEEVLKKLKEKMDESLKQADYWLKGSVYHRVVSEGEKSELMKIILDDAKFDERVAGYFSPQ